MSKAINEQIAEDRFRFETLAVQKEGGEPSFGVIPGAGGAQHLASLMGRARALEVMLSAQELVYDMQARPISDSNGA